MTNDELKKKIVEVVLNSEITGIQIRAITGGYSMANNIADALIAAGIGDVKDVEAEANRYEMLYKLQNRDMALAERRAHDVEHRAVRAERALYNCCFNSLFAPFGIQRPTVDELYDAHLKTAEKELAEEGKE